MADKKNLVMEERKEVIISPIDRSNSSLRTAHFLTPSVTSINAAVGAPFTTPHSLTDFKDLPFQVNFRKLRNPRNKWKFWVLRMQSLHHLTWKSAGIYDSIMSSTSIIRRNTNLIFGFVEKWCPATNSFVFPWGEATITLEDMIVLGGYSVLGDSVLIAPTNSEMEKTVKKLLMERSEISKTKTKCVDQSAWMNKFRDSGSEIEHEAFLAYWLSRFAFPMYTIGRSVLSIAVHLARGIRIALAPAVLASIYQNMSLLKASMTAARKIGTGGECDSVVEVTVSAPLALVQVWIWERFQTLRPNPNSVEPSEPRMARWHDLKKVGIEDLSHRIDSAAKIFEWSTYTKAMDSSFHGKIYIDNEYRVLVDTDLDEGFEGLVRCLRTSELVGLEDNCIEQYLPHRVAMQFGMDQDLPGHVARVNANPEVAWSNYTRPIGDATLYVPPRLSEPGVTARYLKWWKEITYGWRGTNADGVDEKSSFEDSKLEVKEDSTGKETEDDGLVSPPPGFSPKRRRVESGASGNAGIPGLNPDKRNTDFESQEVAERGSPLYSTSNCTEAVLHGKCSFKSSEMILIESDFKAEVSSSPPGFSPKLKKVTAGSSGESGISKPLEDGNADSVPQVSKRQTSSSTPNGSKSGFHEKGSLTSLKTVFIASSSSTKSNSRAPVSPSGFVPKHDSVKTRASGTGNVKRVAELPTSKSYGNIEPQYDYVLGQICSSSTEDNGSFREVTSLLKSAESKVKNTLENKENEQWIDGVGSRNETLKIGVSSGFVESRLSEAPGVALEERVKNIEKLCAWLKAGKLSCILIKKLNK